jgi:hypothetical protein
MYNPYRKAEKKTTDKIYNITTRFGNVLGSNGSVVPLFTKQIADGGPITIPIPILSGILTIPACNWFLRGGCHG